MRENLKKYAKIGLAYHLLYPDCAKDPVYHVRTCIDFINAYDIETFDCIMPFGAEHRQALIPHLKKCGKEIVFNNHISLLRKINPSSNSYIHQELAKVIIADQIDAAKSIGATGYILTSGKNVTDKSKTKTLKNFANYCCWFCNKLRPHGITALLEPFDTSIDKKFILGPTAECVQFIESLDIENLGIELDFAHIPLLGESFYEAIKNTHKHLKRVHLGNCILKDKTSKWYGDKHPPIGIEGGEIDTRELAEILSTLLEFGYLNKKERGALVLEIRPIGKMTQEELVADNFKKLYDAWEMI